MLLRQFKWQFLLVLAGVLAVGAMACASPEPVTVIEEREVVKEVPVEVVKEVEVVRETPVEVEVVREVEVVKETPVEVIREVEVPKEVRSSRRCR